MSFEDGARRLVDALTTSPYHIAYCPALKLRIGPFRRADGKILTGDFGVPDEGTSEALRYYYVLDSVTWKQQLTREMFEAEWFPGLPTGDPIALIAWLTDPVG